MPCVHVVTDSGAALPRGAVHDLALNVVSHSIDLGTARFHSAGGLDEPAFFQSLRQATERPRSLAPAVEDFEEVYRRVLAWGVEIVSLHPPAALSPGVEAARAALDRLPPGSPISVLETAWPATALGLITTRVAEAGLEEWPRAELEELSRAIEAQLRLVVVAGAAAYLESGAGNGPDADEAGPRALLRYENGGFQALGRSPDLGAALREIATWIGDHLDASGARHMAAFSAGADAEAAALATFLSSRHQPQEMWLAPCDPLSAIELGAGAFGVAFYCDPA